jgi:hypothetical protein
MKTKKRDKYNSAAVVQENGPGKKTLGLLHAHEKRDIVTGSHFPLSGG